MIKLLYISSFSSNRVISEIYKSSGQNPGFAIQKFSRLLAQGFMTNGVTMEILSTVPIVGQKYKFINEKQETEDDIVFRYIPFLNVPIVKHICMCVFAFIYVLAWGIKNKKDGYILFDVLRISPSIGALCASKVVGIPTVGLVTDMPGLMVGDKKRWYSRLIAYVNKSYLGAFSYYVFLTEQMNAVINKNNRPYIVMEGLVDVDLSKEFRQVEKSYPKTLLYAGGLYERYGLKMLVDAFVSLNRKDWQLVIYGSGPYAEELKSVCLQNPNVVYKGVAPNDVVVEAEYRASLLVNPRPTTEEFTQYSFPSKNMEYMVSGTPLLTTKLPGMPTEYYDYVYLFEEETTEGYKSKLKELFDVSEKDLEEKGIKAKEFVLAVKNNNVQTYRVLKMCKGNFTR